MAKKWRGPELVKEIDDALNKGLARFLFSTQSKLSAAAPVDTGRLASSWMIGMNQPNREVEPVHETEYIQITKDYNPSEITLKNDWYLSSNLPYSEPVCYDPRYAKGGRRGGAAWFTSIANNLNKDADRAFDHNMLFV